MTKTTPATTKGKPSTERGIVQSVSQGVLVLRTLDGSTITVTVDSSTRVRVNHRPGSLLEIRPGFVAVVSSRGNAPVTIDALGALLTPARVLPTIGAVRSVTHDMVVLALSHGRRAVFAVDPATRIFVEGKLGSIVRLAVGDVVVVRPGAAHARTAYELDAFSPAHISRGTITSATTKAIAVRTPSGTTTTIALTAATPIFVDNAAASALRLRGGLVAVVRTAPRREVFAYGPG